MTCLDSNCYSIQTVPNWWLMTFFFFFPKRSVDWFVRPQSNTTKINENTIIYFRKMGTELCEKQLSCCLAVLFPAPKEHFFPSRIKNVGGWCKSSVSTNCEALKRKEIQWATGGSQLKTDIWRCNTLEVFPHDGSETYIQPCCNFNSTCMYVYTHTLVFCLKYVIL